MVSGAMSLRVILSSDFKKNVRAIKRKDKSLFDAVEKKISQIASLDVQSLHHFKNLRAPLQAYKRVHVGSYVLLFRVENDTVILEAFNHHDQVYMRRP